MKRALPLILLLLCTSPVRAQDAAAPLPTRSLFLSDEEARLADRLARRDLTNDGADVRLGAILYFGPGDWTLWLQGRRWTPTTQDDAIRIQAVSPARVDLIWTDEDGRAHPLSLRANESYTAP